MHITIHGTYVHYFFLLYREKYLGKWDNVLSWDEKGNITPPYVLISISSLPIFTSLRELLVHVFALLIWFSEKAIALF